MLHLPGLVLTDQVNQIVQAVTKLGHVVRGLYGEGTEAPTYLSGLQPNDVGESEADIIERIHKVVLQIIEHETNARATLQQGKNSRELFNHIGRAYGALANAHIVSSKESMNQLSLIRLGVKLGMFDDLKTSVVDELFLITQPAHLQQLVGEKLSGEERDVHRADLLRSRLSGVQGPKVSQ